MATPTTSDFLVVPINGTDLIAFFRGSNISRPLYLRYSTFLDILSQSIGGGTTLLLETNGVQNPSQALLNLIQGSGITITDNGAGGVTIAATGGASFITSISDTADIDLDVTLSDLTATLTTTGVTPNTYGTATQVPQITVDSKGRITGVTLVNITAGTGTVTNVSATVPSPTTPALSVTVTNPTTTPAIAITANGTTLQYVRGNGSLATFPTIPVVTGYVPYTGATTDVNLGVHSFIANDGTYNTEMSPSYFGVENNAATIFALLEYNKLTLTNSVLPSSLSVSATGITFPDLTVQTTAGVTSVGATIPITSSGGNTPTISTSMATNKLIGRYSASTGVMEEVTVGSGLTLTGAGVLNNTATPTPTGYYGAFQDNTIQTAVAINTPYAMKFGINDLSNGVTITSDGSNLTRITIANTGIYNIQFSAQFDRTNSGTDAVDIWLRKNGIDAPGSAGKIILTGGAAASALIATWNYVLDIVAGDYYQIMWSTPDTHVRILYEAAQTSPFAHPIIPSTILTVTQQSGIMAGTGITAINSLTSAAQTLASTDLTISSSVATHTFSIANNAVTYAKMQAISATSRLLGSSSTTTPVQEITATKSVNISASNIELVNDQTSPAYPGVYGIDSTGAKNWRTDTSVRGNIPLLCMQESYPVALNQTSILYVASVSKLYVCNFSSNTISIFDTTTGTTLATLATTGAFRAFYIASINEVWVTSTSLLTINRISVSLNSSLGTIIGATANGAEAVEYSATKVFICCGNATGTIMVVNPSTLLVSSAITLNVPASPNGMVLNTNVASLQYDKIIVSAQLGVAILNPTTNLITTTLVNPSTSISTGTRIRYVTSTNQYVIASAANNNIIVLDIASATTFTLNTTIRNFPGVQDVALDETSGYIFTAFTGLTSSNVLFVSIIDLTTKNVKITIGTNVICGSASTPGYIAMDTPNSRFFVCGRSSNTNVSTAIKYL